jgi:hypothetical protein
MIVARHEVPGITRKIAPSPLAGRLNRSRLRRQHTFQQQYLGFQSGMSTRPRCRSLTPGLGFDDKYLWN